MHGLQFCRFVCYLRNGRLQLLPSGMAILSSYNLNGSEMEGLTYIAYIVHMNIHPTHERTIYT